MNLYRLQLMQQQQRTEENIKGEEEEEVGQEEELEFNNSKRSESVVGLVFVGILVVSMLAVMLKLAMVMSSDPPPVISYSSREGLIVGSDGLQQKQGTQLMTSPQIVLQDIDNHFQQMDITSIAYQRIIEAQRLNTYHVQFKHSLRQSDYSNAKIGLAPYIYEQIDDSTSITYGDFLRTLGLLQLTTLPYVDFSQDGKSLPMQEYEHYQQKYNIKRETEKSICAIMLLSGNGLNSGNYYYAIKGLFQQRYGNYKVVVVDDTPELGLQAEVLGLIKEVWRDREVVVLDRISGQASQGSSIYFSLHKHCKDTQLTLILRDNGQLIGQYAFSLLNKIHSQQQVPLVISHHLLDMGNLFTNLKNYYRYKVPLYPQNKISRKGGYKTKYLKSYQTQLLMDLPLGVFQAEGLWRNQGFEGLLEFSAVERACGKYFVLEEILYRVPKTQIQSASIIQEVRRAPKAHCNAHKTQNFPSPSTEISFNREFRQFDSNLIPLSEIDDLTQVQKRALDTSLILHHRGRNKLLRKKIMMQEHAIANGLGNELQLREEQVLAMYQMDMGYDITIYDREELDLEEEGDIFEGYDMIYLDSLKVLKRGKNYGKVPHYHTNTHPSQKQIEIQHKESTFFCIILTTEDNQEQFDFLYSVQSVLKQEYGNYRLVVLDNASKDSTAKMLKRHYLMLGREKARRMHVYGAKESKTKGENIYFGVRKSCQKGEVLITMQAGDELVGSYVLETLNEEYRHGNTLAAYSRSIALEENNVLSGNGRAYEQSAIEGRKYREFPLTFGPLRSFKTDLFFKIKEEDFKYQGGWISKELQFNLSFAILEMSCEKARFIDEILYKQSKIGMDQPLLHQQVHSQTSTPNITNSTSTTNISPNQNIIIPQSQIPSVDIQRQKKIAKLKSFSPIYKCISQSYISVNP